MKRPDARTVAYDALLDTEAGDFADAALGERLARIELDRRERDLATLLVYGTTARRQTLDYTIAGYAGRPLDKIDPAVLVLLRLGLFQLGFCDRVPAYAAVDRTVALADGKNRKAAGFVNAVLRRSTRDGLRGADHIAQMQRGVSGDSANTDPSDTLDLTRSWRELDPDRRRAIAFSHPLWLVRRWTEELGEAEADNLMQENNEAAPNVLRTLIPRDEAIPKLRDMGVRVKEAAHAPQAVIASSAQRFPGLALPQGEASQLVVQMLRAQDDEKILDACASPGGKTAFLASEVGRGGEVVAVDKARGSARRIDGTLRAAGFVYDKPPRIRVIEDDILRMDPAELDGPFDAVLVDAPCSGLGTLRQHPEIRWRRDPSDITDLGRRQRAILAAAAKELRPGGRLVYSTCTIMKAENEEVVDEFLAENPDFAADATAPCGDEQGRFRSFPHHGGMDGFFAAALKRKP